jgi:RimJ/RimL family protein N-acetyltransferase
VFGEDGVVNHPQPVTLSDADVVLRCPTLDQVPAIAAACQDRELHRWLEALPDPYTEESAEAFVQQCGDHWATGKELVFAISAADSAESADSAVGAGAGRLLGMIGLHDLSRLTAPGGGMAEVGFWTVAAERGRGVIPRALRLVCRYGFEELGLARIEWQAEVGNVSSLRAAEKVGFVFEGTCRRRLLHLGGRVDGWLAGLLPEELR